MFELLRQRWATVSRMQSWHGGRLTGPQAALVDRWLPDAWLRGDMSWELTDTVVLDTEAAGGRVVIKAAGPHNHHIGREITAYQSCTEPLAQTGHAPPLLHHDRSANILVLGYLQGSLVEGSEAEFAADTYRQAGRLARTFHDQGSRFDPDWDASAVMKSLQWLGKPHRIEPRVVDRLRAILVAHHPRPAVVVPTHGDWQPRNWLIGDGAVKVIDFGRFAWRPAVSDFCRLAAQQWLQAPALEAAFFDGYGGDPRDRDEWRMFSLHEAIGTAVWAHQAGDADFERQGHRMIAGALALF